MISNVNSIQSAVGPKGVESVGAINAGNPPVASAGVNDVVEISTAAKLAAKIHEIPDVRAELVSRVKAEIASGTYETPQRIDAAVDKLMDELLGEF